MDASDPPSDRPTHMRIDPTRCRQGRLCTLLAPEIDGRTRIDVTPATLDAMASCPTGALTWDENGVPGSDPGE